MCGYVGRQDQGVEVGGHATLHQGDKNTTLNVGPGNTIHISVQGNLEWARTGRKRPHDDDNTYEPDLCCLKAANYSKGGLSRLQPTRTLGDQDSDPTDSTGSALAVDERAVIEGVKIVAQILQASVSDENLSSLQEQTEHLTLTALQSVQSTLHATSGAKCALMLSLIDRVRQNALLPVIAKVFPTPCSRVQQEAMQEVMSFGNHGNPSTQLRLMSPAQDLVSAFVAMLALMSYETSQSGNHASTSKSSLGKVSLIAGLATFAVARYFCVPQLVKHLSEWAGGSLLIQNPFLRDLRVPIAHADHFILLEAFLRHKLGGTTAEAFIDAGQFKLTLNQRHGPAVHKSDWSIKGRIKHDQRLVMSVFVKKVDANCLDCDLPLSMSDLGRYTCHPCGKAYGNCASLKYLSDLARRPTISPKAVVSTAQTHQITRMPRIVEMDEEEEEADDAYNVDGLQNIDFQILRKKQTAPTKLVSKGLSEPPTSDHFLGQAGENRSLEEDPNPNQHSRDRHLATIRVNLIHVLAIEPSSLEYLALGLRVKRSELEELLEEVSQDTGGGKKTLKDRIYRDLDIWSFPYQSNTVRQAAIENAITALDRMKIAQTDEAWQMLLHLKDRGKGILLSTLNFTSPLAVSSTPSV